MRGVVAALEIILQGPISELPKELDAAGQIAKKNARKGAGVCGAGPDPVDPLDDIFTILFSEVLVLDLGIIESMVQELPYANHNPSTMFN